MLHYPAWGWILALLCLDKLLKHTEPHLPTLYNGVMESTSHKEHSGATLMWPLLCNKFLCEGHHYFQSPMSYRAVSTSASDHQDRVNPTVLRTCFRAFCGQMHAYIMTRTPHYQMMANVSVSPATTCVSHYLWQLHEEGGRFSKQ